jgi:hypothetical protein
MRARARAWLLFEAQRASVEAERGVMQAHRVRDEFWYAGRFGLDWPTLAAISTDFLPRAAADAQNLEPTACPSPIPCPDPGTIMFADDPIVTGFTMPSANSKIRKDSFLTCISNPIAVCSMDLRVGGIKRATVQVHERNTDTGYLSFSVRGTSKSVTECPCLPASTRQQQGVWGLAEAL